MRNHDLAREAARWSMKRWSRKIDEPSTLAFFAAKRAVDLYIARHREEK